MQVVIVEKSFGCDPYSFHKVFADWRLAVAAIKEELKQLCPDSDPQQLEINPFVLRAYPEDDSYEYRISFHDVIGIEPEE